MFLNITELKTVALTEVVNLITNSDDTIIEQIIAESIDLIKSYLHNYYDINIIFEATGTDRSLIVLKYLKDIVIYEIYIRRSHDFNEVTKSRYDEAILWLEKVAKGIINPDLPIKTEEIDGENTSATFLKIGSKQRYKTGW